MTHAIEIFIPMTADQKAELKSISDREKALAAERADFVMRACMEHPDVKVAARLAHYSHKPRAEIVSGSQFKVAFAFPTAVGAKSSAATSASTRVAPEYMDPKTMNLLLSSKMLTDEEKRRMLAAVFPRTMELVKAPDAVAPEPPERRAAVTLLGIIDDSKAWPVAVNAMLGELNTSDNAELWSTVSEARSALKAALRAIAEDG